MIKKSLFKLRHIKAELGIHTLAGKISMVFGVLLMVFVLIFGSVMGYYFHTTTKSTLTEMLSLVIESNAKNLNGLISKIDTSTSLFQNSSSPIYSYLTEDGNFIRKMNAYNALENAMNTTVSTTLVSSEEYCGLDFFIDPHMSIASVFVDNAEMIFSTDGYYYSPIIMSNTNTVQSEDWYRETINKNGSSYWFKSSTRPNILCNARTLYVNHKEKDYYEKIGVILTNIDVSWMAKNLNVSSLTADTILSLSDWNNRSIYAERVNDMGHNNQVQLDPDIIKMIEFDGQEIVNDGKRYQAYKNQMDGGLSMVTLVPVRDLNRILARQLLLLLVVAIFLLLAGTAAIFYFSRLMARPIKRLAQHMKVNQDLQMLDSSGIKEEETLTIYNNYNQFVKRISELINEIYESAKQEKAAQIKALQAQINPHFIYNTLDTICCISLVRNQQDIAEILSQLATMMRYNTKEPDAMVPVKRELEFIYSYKSIQAFRDNGEVSIRDNADETIKNMMIPKMIIQPLVENSVFYGVSDDGKVDIDIHFSYTDTKVIIQVSDAGTSGDAEQINAHLTGEINISKNNSGLGIRNVNERIKLNYGDDYGLHFEKQSDGKIVAIINIPRIDR